MNCRKACSLMSAYIDGELSGADQLQIRSHLRHCAACQVDHDSLLDTKRMFSRLAMQSPTEVLEERILAHIAQEASGRGPFQFWFDRLHLRLHQPLNRWTIAAAGAATALVIVWPRTSSQPNEIVPVLSAKSQPSVTEAGIPVRDGLFLHDARQYALPQGPAYGIQPAGAQFSTTEPR